MIGKPKYSNLETSEGSGCSKSRVGRIECEKYFSRKQGLFELPGSL